jgi:hypothetical protein
MPDTSSHLTIFWNCLIAKPAVAKLKVIGATVNVSTYPKHRAGTPLIANNPRQLHN